MYDARQIANWFVRRAACDGRELSIISLLRLAYISHGWHLAISGQPLFRNKVEAWQHGPIIPDVYHAFQKQGIMIKIPTCFAAQHDAIAAGDEDLLEQIYDKYSHISPFRLSEMLNEVGGPWDLARRASGWFAPITNDLIHLDFAAKRRAALE